MVHWMMEDDAHSVWLYTACGLVRIARSDLDAWASNPKQTIQAAVFDSSDGVSSHRFPGGYSANVAKSADGKLWFLRPGGVSVIDPHHLAFNKLPPPVHIEQVTADDKIYDATNGLRLPARTARSRDRLHGAEPGRAGEGAVPLHARRTGPRLEGGRQRSAGAVFEPRSGRLPLPRHREQQQRRVERSRRDAGILDRAGVLPDALVPGAGRGRRPSRLVWAGYRGRVRQVARQYQRRLDERVNERTRIARELHDTLLQSFHGLLLQFQTAAYLLPERPAEARAQLDGAIVHAAKAITEGRDAVQGLRASTRRTQRSRDRDPDPGRRSSRATRARRSRPTFSVAVEGETRDLHPIVRDEIYKIAAEALRNAFRHAHAGRVEVEIRYDDEQFRLRVRDDGRGIDPEVLANQGLEGHYGLRGMPERAALIGGKLAVWSEVGAGTEVELRLPARIVYATSAEALVAVAAVGLQGVRHTQEEDAS